MADSGSHKWIMAGGMCGIKMIINQFLKHLSENTIIVKPTKTTSATAQY